ncbi:hypothetical protein SAMN04487770_1062 [Butyrivibrio sp. ob235]|uniref:hypothetical protein n=1 Tax=unclassified Butyrivibrio TaxID=2639466 RepID=UPI0003B35AAB|nr:MULTISPECIES: hypothetical protein [unclassified Butyrivibrio]SEL10072.1 hypothetical protein SAMN04487770_1062 [Butyrivibrio sp. ob235]
MSYDLSSSMGRLTDLYLDKTGLSGSGSLLSSDGIYRLGKGNKKSAVDAISSSFSKADEAKEKVGKEFSDVYDSLQAMRTLNNTMRQSYDMNHKEDRKKQSMDRHSAMNFSKGSSRIMDMLSTQINTEMDNKVSKAMKNGIDSITDNKSEKR